MIGFKDLTGAKELTDTPIALDGEGLTRPIIGIENRSAQEVFDIMADRIRRALVAAPVAWTSQSNLDGMADHDAFVIGSMTNRQTEAWSIALYASPSPAGGEQTAGWVTVPREPTEAMTEAGRHPPDDLVLRDSHAAQQRAYAAAVYRAMLTAAPSPAQSAIPQEARAERWPTKGDRMTFLGRNGYDSQLAHAKTIFDVGAEYEVERCEVGDWSHSVWFKGIEGSFNGVMFSLSPAPASRQDK